MSTGSNSEPSPFRRCRKCRGLVNVAYLAPGWRCPGCGFGGAPWHFFGFQPPVRGKATPKNNGAGGGTPAASNPKDQRDVQATTAKTPDKPTPAR